MKNNYFPNANIEYLCSNFERFVFPGFVLQFSEISQICKIRCEICNRTTGRYI